MANRTVKDARNVHGTNPQYLIEKIIRSRIYDSKFWKEQCFALTAELLVDKAMEIRFVGGVFGGNIRPTPFLCLTLKMLQIQPEKDIVVEFIKNEEFKYVRALGAFYLRLTGTSLDCYKYLEPLYNDNRKLRNQNRSGQFEIQHMDEYIDELLRSDRVCDIILPRIQKRSILEENNELEPKVSALDDDLDEEMAMSDNEDDDDADTMEVPAPRSSGQASSSKTAMDTSFQKPSHKREIRERSRSRERSGRGEQMPENRAHYASSGRRGEQRADRGAGGATGGDRERNRERQRDADVRDRDRRHRDRDEYERDTRADYRDQRSSKPNHHRDYYEELQHHQQLQQQQRKRSDRDRDGRDYDRDYERDYERGAGGRDGRDDDRRKSRKLH